VNDEDKGEGGNNNNNNNNMNDCHVNIEEGDEEGDEDNRAVMDYRER
jgi:hypothetical protein